MDEGKNKVFWLDSELRRISGKKPPRAGLDGLLRAPKNAAKRLSGTPVMFDNVPKTHNTAPQVVKKEITVKLELPKIGLFKALKSVYHRLWRAVKSHKLKVAVPGVALALIVAGIGLKNSLQTDPTTPKQAVEGVQTTKSLNFEPLLPAQAKSIQDMATATVLTSEAGEPYLKFSDEFQKVNISVSQQKFVGRKIEDVAAALQAPQKVQVGTNTAYIKTNTKQNQQFVVYSAGDVLVSINSTGILDNFAWQVYLKSLKQ